MDIVHLSILAAGVALILGGARMIYCGHKSIRRGHHDRRIAERRDSDRRSAA